MRPAGESLIAELEIAVKSDLLESRIETLRRVTDQIGRASCRERV
jgi:hypothetical protein